MRRFIYNKLIRDKILDHMLAQGEIVNHKVLTDTEYLNQLRLKLIEEAKELDPQNREQAIKEIADLQEVIDALVKALGKTPADVKKEQTAKRASMGSFDQRIYIDSISIPEDNPWIKYLESHPDRYPEIT